MALKNVAKMLFRRFSSGTRSVGGIETNNIVIRDDKLRSVYVRLEQATEQANQLADECNTIYISPITNPYPALKRELPRDRLTWLWFIISLALTISDKAVKTSQTKIKIKDKESELSALRTKNQELHIPV
ncbi:hypothetical protein MKX01_011432 [Papaver californicum]|nr:hypothetical protein MKX01_011432 [Papaver californicum]